MNDKALDILSIIKNIYLYIKKTVVLYRDTITQVRRFNRHYARLSGGKEQAATLTVFYSHQIEKGLSHLSFREGFGKTPLKNLSNAMMRLRALDHNYEENPSYRIALGALREYIEKNSGSNDALEYLNTVFSKEVLEEAMASEATFGGSLQLERNADRNDSFASIAKNRHSVREYSPAPVTIDELMPALEEAGRSPSACNRQPTRIRVLLDGATIERALKVQGGFGGYKTPPALLLVTSDCRSFVGPQERNEGYIDAGMFSMTLLYALEEHDLAACPLNTMLHRKEEDETRKLLGIADWETLVMYIAVGHFPDKVRVCRSHRFPVSDIITVI